MALRRSVVLVPLWAAACGARSELLFEEAPVASGGASGGGASSSGRSGGAPGRGSGESPGRGGSEPTLLVDETFPEPAAAPEVALAMAPSGEAAVFFFKSREDSVGHARWSGVSWEPAPSGTQEGIERVRRAWIAEDGARAWVSYVAKKESPSYPLSSEVFVGGLPQGFSMSFQAFRLPRTSASFDAPPEDVAVGPEGDTAAAFLSHSRKQYVFRNTTASGVVAGFLSPLAAGKERAGALIGFPNGIYWEEARYFGRTSLITFSDFIEETSVGWFGQDAMVAIGLTYTKHDVGWGAWRIAAPPDREDVSLIRVARLEADRAPQFFELAIGVTDFAEGGGIAIGDDESFGVVLWAQRFPHKSQVRFAVIQDGLLFEKSSFDLPTEASCRVSSPMFAQRALRFLASAHCSDGSAYLFGMDWFWPLPGKVASLPAVAINEDGSIGLALWTEEDGQNGDYLIQTRTLVW